MEAGTREKLHILDCFRRLEEMGRGSSRKPDASISESSERIPFKESSTLNQILYVNERHNKRELPKNDDKKNLYEILKPNTISKETFDKRIEDQINDIGKEWKHISTLQKRNLVKNFCERNHVTLTDEVLRTILNNDQRVKYCPSDTEIVHIQGIV